MKYRTIKFVIALLFILNNTLLSQLDSLILISTKSNVGKLIVLDDGELFFVNTINYSDEMKDDLFKFDNGDLGYYCNLKIDSINGWKFYMDYGGYLRSLYKVKNGLGNGVALRFWDNNDLTIETIYYVKNNNQIGIRKEFDESGVLLNESNSDLLESTRFFKGGLYVIRIKK